MNALNLIMQQESLRDAGATKQNNETKVNMTTDRSSLLVTNTFSNHLQDDDDLVLRVAQDDMSSPDKIQTLM